MTPTEARRIIEGTGATWRGVALGSLALFDDPDGAHRSTMALRLGDVTAERVREHMAAKRKEYGE